MHFSFSDVTGALSTLLAKIKEFLGKAAAFAGRVLGAILYGLLNGILMGTLFKGNKVLLLELHLCVALGFCVAGCFWLNIATVGWFQVCWIM